MIGYWPSFVRVGGGSVSGGYLEGSVFGQYPAILTKQYCSIKDYFIICKKNTIFLLDTVGSPKKAR